MLTPKAITKILILKFNQRKVIIKGTCHKRADTINQSCPTYFAGPGSDYYGSFTENVSNEFFWSSSNVEMGLKFSFSILFLKQKVKFLVYVHDQD